MTSPENPHHAFMYLRTTSGQPEKPLAESLELEADIPLTNLPHAQQPIVDYQEKNRQP